MREYHHKGWTEIHPDHILLGLTEHGREVGRVKLPTTADDFVAVWNESHRLVWTWANDGRQSELYLLLLRQTGEAER